jgi:hypothetical protein
MEIFDVNENGEDVYIDFSKYFEYQYRSKKMYSKCLKRYLKERGFEFEPLPTARQLFDEMHRYKKIMENSENKVNDPFYERLIDGYATQIKNREYVDPSDKKMVDYSNQYKMVVDGFESSKEFKKFLEIDKKIYDDLKVERPFDVEEE